MVNEPYVPDRGDLIILTFNPTKGHEQAGRRPAIVLSAHSYNQKSGLALACPISRRPPKYRFDVPISYSTIKGVILADQIRCMAWRERNARRIDKAPLWIIEATLEKIQEILLINSQPSL